MALAVTLTISGASLGTEEHTYRSDCMHLETCSDSPSENVVHWTECPRRKTLSISRLNCLTTPKRKDDTSTPLRETVKHHKLSQTRIVCTLFPCRNCFVCLTSTTTLKRTHRKQPHVWVGWSLRRTPLRLLGYICFH